MYAIKVLSGSQVGQVFPLHHSETIVGRSDNCGISLPNKNISKQHAKILIEEGKIIFTDLNSTNGSFVNGVKVEMTLLKEGDKIALFDTILTLVEDSHSRALPGATELEIEGDVVDPNASLQYATPVDQGLAKLDQYLDKAAVSPFYLLMEKMSFKWIISLFALALIVLTSLLSTIPLMSIIQDSVEMESKNRARSLAKLIATTNRDALRTNSYSGLSVALGFKEPGVKKAMIIRQETGEVLSPARLSGQYVSGPIEGQINSYRKFTDRPHHTFKANSTTIISMYPIKFYSNAEGLEVTKFYSVVIYNAKVLASSGKQTLSLIIQTLFLALLFGSLLLYFLLKIIDRPFKKLQSDISKAITDPLNPIESKILYPPIQNVYTSVQSLLNRSQSAGQVQHVTEVDRTYEVQNISSLIGYANIIISNSDESILDYNPYFEELTNLYDIKGQRVNELSDQALQQNLIDLIERCRLTPDSVNSNDFEFSGTPYEVKMQTVHGSQDISYFVCAFIPAEEE